MEACRARAGRAEAESRGRVEADVARERASLRGASSALEVERRELLQRAARAESVGEAKAVEVISVVFFFRAVYGSGQNSRVGSGRVGSLETLKTATPDQTRPGPNPTHEMLKTS